MFSWDEVTPEDLMITAVDTANTLNTSIDQKQLSASMQDIACTHDSDSDMPVWPPSSSGGNGDGYPEKRKVQDSKDTSTIPQDSGELKNPDPPIVAAKQSQILPRKKKKKRETLSSKYSRCMKGIAYDFKNYGKVKPPDTSQGKMSYILTRDDRSTVVCTLLFGFMVMVTLVYILSSKPKVNRLPYYP